MIKANKNFMMKRKPFTMKLLYVKNLEIRNFMQSHYSIRLLSGHLEQMQFSSAPVLKKFYRSAQRRKINLLLMNIQIDDNFNEI